MPSELIHCIYASAARPGLTAAELAGLLEAAQENNARLGLTGMLLYAEGSFFQVLEGRPAVVDALYARIERDERHGQVTLIIREPIARRHFEAWSMGFCEVSREALAGIAGANALSGSDRPTVGADAGRARKLLAAFRDGRWRKKLPDAGTAAAA